MLIDWLLCPLKLYMNWTPEWQKMNDCCFQNTKKETAVLQWMSYFTAACSFIDYPKNTTGRSHVMRREEYPSSAGVSSSSERTIPVHVVTATKQKKNTHLHDEIYSLIGRGAEIAWQTGGAVLKLMLRRFVSHRRELKRLFCHHFFKSVIMSPHR